VVDGLNLIEGVVLRCTHAQLLAVSLQQFSSDTSWNQNYISPLFSLQMQGAVFRVREGVGPRFLARSTLSLSLSLSHRFCSKKVQHYLNHLATAEITKGVKHHKQTAKTPRAAAAACFHLEPNK